MWPRSLTTVGGRLTLLDLLTGRGWSRCMVVGLLFDRAALLFSVVLPRCAPVGFDEVPSRPGATTPA